MTWATSKLPRESSKRRRARLGLAKPVKCPFCNAMTPQRDVDFSNHMLRALTEGSGRRQCLTCYRYFSKVRPGGGSRGWKHKRLDNPGPAVQD